MEGRKARYANMYNGLGNRSAITCFKSFSKGRIFNMQTQKRIVSLILENIHLKDCGYNEARNSSYVATAPKKV